MTASSRVITSASGPLRGIVRAPGSKSLSNRVLLLAALARGTSRIHGLLRSDDTNAMLAGLGALGAVSRWDGAVLEIDGCAGRFPNGATIDVGHGGTPARFLMTAACLADGPVHIDGTDRLRERPMQDGVDALRSLQMEVQECGSSGCLPITVRSVQSDASTVQIGATRTSQFISALMLIGAALPSGIVLEFTEPLTSRSYVLLTAHVLEQWGIGVECEQSGDRIEQVRIRPGMIAARECTIAPDASSIAYWAVAASIVPGSDLMLQDVHEDDPQPDMGVVRALADGGATLDWSPDGLRVSGPQTFVGWRALDASNMPDGAMALAVAAACGTKAVTITGLETLRVKETDRIAALQCELTTVGAETRGDASSLRIQPLPSSLQDPGAPPVEIRTYDDHRMAMAFAILGLRRGGLSILDPECVNKSYPGFWDDLQALVDDQSSGARPSQ
ncbi:MAG: 3-phosphoshikimate 1-carboxyvinyltransferase [Phycisphaerales bacterium]|nr:3-phosphoshikimate 1-carboxyvinyltransferase [Phycisphaerales bacterium]